jgi:hypothetical protein
MASEQVTGIKSESVITFIGISILVEYEPQRRGNLPKPASFESKRKAEFDEARYRF